MLTRHNEYVLTQDTNITNKAVHMCSAARSYKHLVLATGMFRTDGQRIRERHEQQNKKLQYQT
jgi:hypothetical protein